MEATAAVTTTMKPNRKAERILSWISSKELGPLSSMDLLSLVSAVAKRQLAKTQKKVFQIIIFY